ncbi:MAG TPA: SDR family NAD(P)-dependent oxidoreductase, partial [Herpetosiphonaceae bacterium]
LSTHAESESLAQKLRAVQRLEQLGAEVMLLQANAADATQMQAALAQIDDCFGALHGVLYTAGLADYGSIIRPLATTSRAVDEALFEAKIHGLYVLDRLLDGRALDFCLLFSSVATTLGGLGFSAYSAANLFMDAFAASRTQTSTVPWISASWDGWPTETSAHPRGTIHTSMDQYIMTIEQATEAFERVVLAAPEGQVIVATGDLGARYELWIRRPFRAGEQGAGSETGLPSIATRPELRESYVAPTSQIERQIAEIWQDVLGIAQVGIYDNFFELGGHSLMATQVMSRLRNVAQIDLPLQTLFEQPTVAGLATLVVQRQVEMTDRQELAQLLAEIKQLSSHEAQQQLEHERQSRSKDLLHE